MSNFNYVSICMYIIKKKKKHDVQYEEQIKKKDLLHENYLTQYICKYVIFRKSVIAIKNNNK